MTEKLQHKIENIISLDNQADDREILFQLKQLLYEMELQNYTETETKNIADIIYENIQQLDNEKSHNDVIKSGFDDLDKLVGGFRLGEFIVIGGRPAMGKTQFLINISLNISSSTPVLYVTLDLSEFLLTSRFASSASEIPSDNIINHSLSEIEKNILSSIAGELKSNHQLFIHDSCNTSIAALKAYCQKQIQEKGIKVVIVDYLQLLTSYQHRKYRENEVSYICRELKNLAKEYNVCVIASSQLSRAVELRHPPLPQLSDLRESGAIEQDADKVLFIYRPEYYGFKEDENLETLQGIAEIIVAKNKSGRLGSFKLRTNYNNLSDLKNCFTFSSHRLSELNLENLGDLPF